MEPVFFGIERRDDEGQEEWEDRLNAGLSDRVASCTPEVAEEFWSLADCFKQDPSDRSIPKDIMATNGFIEDGVEGLFLLGSRFNHSCLPNMTRVWGAEPDKPLQSTLMFRAKWDIEQGEELTHFYIETRQSRAERQADLRDFRFSCCCPTCSLTGAALALSDTRRERLLELYEEDCETADGYLANALESVSLINDEFNGDPWLLHISYNTAFTYACRLGLLEDAAAYSEKQLLNQELSLGAGHPDILADIERNAKELLQAAEESEESYSSSDSSDSDD
ncbi:hypothetical protein KIPB_008704 [Kipferlia bialata]|uniref:SET domain-containing protein n=1 Tax=Kipferlia bialata TaxID=797122 RepID=A0A9K3D378_9EUKA|nr:hypothetical protein KIPB_008704 [Kipferlia bialata]|eukprot:g8704.t1